MAIEILMFKTILYKHDRHFKKNTIIFIKSVTNPKKRSPYKKPAIIT